MDEKEFSRLDRQMMKATRSLRERPVDPRLGEDFARDVEKRLPSRARSARPWGWRAWVPVPAAAVLVLSLVVVLRLPGARLPVPVTNPAVTSASGARPAATPTAAVPQAAAGPAAAELLAADIEALRQLGVWGAEDEAEIGFAEETLWEETGAA